MNLENKEASHFFTAAIIGFVVDLLIVAVLTPYGLVSLQTIIILDLYLLVLLVLLLWQKKQRNFFRQMLLSLLVWGVIMAVPINLAFTSPDLYYTLYYFRCLLPSLDPVCKFT